MRRPETARGKPKACEACYADKVKCVLSERTDGGLATEVAYIGGELSAVSVKLGRVAEAVELQEIGLDRIAVAHEKLAEAHGRLSRAMDSIAQDVYTAVWTFKEFMGSRSASAAQAGAGAEEAGLPQGETGASAEGETEITAGNTEETPVEDKSSEVTVGNTEAAPVEDRSREETAPLAFGSPKGLTAIQDSPESPSAEARSPGLTLEEKEIVEESEVGMDTSD